MNKYIGERYVPLIDGEWDSSKKYEPLTVVLYQGNSYTSKTYVPKGIVPTNEEYWVCTGNYNAQVEQYRQDVQEALEEISEIADDINEKVDGFDEKVEEFETNYSEMMSTMGKTYGGMMNTMSETYSGMMNGMNQTHSRNMQSMSEAFNTNTRLFNELAQTKSTELSEQTERHRSSLNDEERQLSEKMQMLANGHETRLEEHYNSYEENLSQQADTYASSLEEQFEPYQQVIDDGVEELARRFPLALMSYDTTITPYFEESSGHLIVEIPQRYVIPARTSVGFTVNVPNVTSPVGIGTYSEFCYDVASVEGFKVGLYGFDVEVGTPFGGKNFNVYIVNNTNTAKEFNSYGTTKIHLEALSRKVPNVIDFGAVALSSNMTDDNTYKGQVQLTFDSSAEILGNRQNKVRVKFSVGDELSGTGLQHVLLTTVRPLIGRQHGFIFSNVTIQPNVTTNNLVDVTFDLECTDNVHIQSLNGRTIPVYLVWDNFQF